MRWFRFYDDTLNNPKAQRLSGDLYKAWINLLCLASKNRGALPSINDIAFALRTTEQKAVAWLEALISAELFDRNSDGIRPHDWDEWQRESDGAAERMRRHRERKRDGGSDGTSQSQTPNSYVTVTSPVQNSDGLEQKQIQNRTDSEKNAADDARARDWQTAYQWIEQTLNSGTPLNGSRIHAWLAAGADLELDIKPTITRLLGKMNGRGPPSTLNYFDRAIADAMLSRLTPMPAGKYRPTKDNRYAAISAAVEEFSAFCRTESSNGPSDPGTLPVLPAPEHGRG